MVVFDAEGNYLRQWGSAGSGDGQFVATGGGHPHCVVLGNDGLVYACDRGQNRIQVFDRVGNLVRIMPIDPPAYGEATLRATGHRAVARRRAAAPVRRRPREQPGLDPGARERRHRGQLRPLRPHGGRVHLRPHHRGRLARRPVPGRDRGRAAQPEVRPRRRLTRRGPVPRVRARKTELATLLRRALQRAVVGALLVPERWRSGVAYNPPSPRMTRDPYPLYAELRARDPVHRSRLLDAWVFSRHADVDAIPARLPALLQRPAQARPRASPPPPVAAAPRADHPLPGPARSHAAAVARQQGVHAAGGHRARGAHPRHGGRAARRRGPRRVRPDGSPGQPAAGDGHRRDAGRAAGRPGAVQGLVEPARPDPRADGRRPRNCRSRSRPAGRSTRTSAPSSRPGAPSRATTSSARSSTSRRRATG